VGDLNKRLTTRIRDRHVLTGAHEPETVFSADLNFVSKLDSEYRILRMYMTFVFSIKMTCSKPQYRLACTAEARTGLTTRSAMQQK
jgi:hypothetical protein